MSRRALTLWTPVPATGAAVMVLREASWEVSRWALTLWMQGRPRYNIVQRTHPASSWPSWHAICCLGVANHERVGRAHPRSGGRRRPRGARARPARGEAPSCNTPATQGDDMDGCHAPGLVHQGAAAAGRLPTAAALAARATHLAVTWHSSVGNVPAHQACRWEALLAVDVVASSPLVALGNCWPGRPCCLLHSSSRARASHGSAGHQRNSYTRQLAVLTRAVGASTPPALLSSAPNRVAMLVEPSPFTYVCGYMNRYRNTIRFLTEAGVEVLVVTPGPGVTAPGADFSAACEQPNEFQGARVVQAFSFGLPWYPSLPLSFGLSPRIYNQLKCVAPLPCRG